MDARKRWVMGCVATAAVGAAAIGAVGSTALAGGGPVGQVTICHATGSASNPYVVIHPATPAVLRAHLDHHDGADIVPPFTFKGTSYPGQNWTAEGAAIAANGCLAATTPPAPAPPVDEPETPQPPAPEPPAEEQPPPGETPPPVFSF